MVCDKCEQKLTKVIVPDIWKDGARNTIGGKDGGAKIGGPCVSRHARTTTNRTSPMDLVKHCRICKGRCSLPQYHYCQQCAYKKGICAMCGRKIVDTSGYRMTAK